MSAIVGTIHDILVGPFEIESVDQGFAYALVFELVAPRIDKPALSTRRRIIGQHAALDASVLECREIVACRPEACREFLAKQIIFGSKTFKRDVAIAIIFEPNHVEIILPARNRKVGAPPVL